MIFNKYITRSAFKSALLACAFAIGGCSTPIIQPTQPSDQIVENHPAANTHAPTITVEDIVVSKPELPDDLWHRIRQGFQLSVIENTRVNAQLRWYASHQAYMDRVADRATPYFHYIVEAVEEREIPLEIALLPIVESAFDPFAYSHGRAAGLWQFVPGTGRRFKLKQNWWYDGRRDVAEATRAALDYLEYLHSQFDDWLLALAAYNSGEGNVFKAIRRNRAQGKPVDFWNLRLPRETRAYVPKLLALQRIVSNPDTYNITLKTVADEPRLARVRLTGQIDLALVAELADVPVSDVYLLNPGFNRWATDPDGPHELFLPLEKKDLFEARLTEIPADQHVRWRRHKIGSGETLSEIAARYNTTVSMLRQINGISGNVIRSGKHLLVPVAAQNMSAYNLSESQRLARKRSIPRGDQKVIHTVRPGDSFWEIARRYGTTVRQVASWNGMAPRDPLRVGEELVIWTDKPNMPAAAIPANTVRTITYTVRRGDSLSRISAKFGVSVSDLLRWNGISSKKYLQPGQKLKLYVDVTKQST